MYCGTSGWRSKKKRKNRKQRYRKRTLFNQLWQDRFNKPWLCGGGSLVVMNCIRAISFLALLLVTALILFYIFLLIFKQKKDR